MAIKITCMTIAHRYFTFESITNNEKLVIQFLWKRVVEAFRSMSIVEYHQEWGVRRYRIKESIRRLLKLTALRQFL